MSDKMRWRYGETNPVRAAVDAETLIEIGDLLWLDGDNAKPASLFPGDVGDVHTQEDFVGRFLGVAMQRSHVGEIDPIRVATTGVFEFNCAADTFELGDFMGPSVYKAAGCLDDQAVAPALKAFAIGRVAKREPTPTDTVLVDIRSTVMTGGV